MQQILSQKLLLLQCITRRPLRKVIEQLMIEQLMMLRLVLTNVLLPIASLRKTTTWSMTA
jgi:hypothetical protein